MYKYENIEDSLDYIINAVVDLRCKSDSGYQRRFIDKYIDVLKNLERDLPAIYDTAEYDSQTQYQEAVCQ